MKTAAFLNAESGLLLTDKTDSEVGIMIYLCMLCAATVISATACILFRSRNKSFEGMICKFLASFGFIAIAILGNYLNNSHNLRYFSLICVALMFGLYGDVFLGIKEIAPSFRKKLMPVGTAFFLVGHIVYIWAFQGVHKIFWPSVLFFPAGIVMAILIIVIGKLKFEPAFGVILCLYYGLLVWKIAASAFLVYNDHCIANCLCLISSCLFFISDNCLAMLYFFHSKGKNALVTVELSTYYPAQILYALSVFFR